MSRHVVAEMTLIRHKAKAHELGEELGGGVGALSGELVPTDKVEDVLETLNLPGPAAADEPAAPAAEDLEATPEEEEPEVLEESLSPEDPVRLYLREIGRISLLTAEREVTLGQQIERGQERVRRAIMAVPLVRQELVALSERLRKHEAEPEAFLEAPDGTELSEPELRRVLGVFAQIRRLDRELGELEAARRRARKLESRKVIQEWMTHNHRTRVRLLGNLPLKPMVVERWVGRVKSLAQELGGLVRRLETGTDAAADGARAAARRRIREIEAEVGLPYRRLVAFMRDVEAGEFEVRLAKKALMEANLRLVVSIAKRYLNHDMPLLTSSRRGTSGS